MSLLGLAEARYVSQSDPELIISLLEESLALSREVGDKMGIAACIRLSGQLALSQGNATELALLLRRALVLFREIGDRQNTALVALLVSESGSNPRELSEQHVRFTSRVWLGWREAWMIRG